MLPWRHGNILFWVCFDSKMYVWLLWQHGWTQFSKFFFFFFQNHFWYLFLFFLHHFVFSHSFCVLTWRWVIFLCLCVCSFVHTSCDLFLYKKALLTFKNSWCWQSSRFPMEAPLRCQDRKCKKLQNKISRQSVQWKQFGRRLVVINLICKRNLLLK